MTDAGRTVVTRCSLAVRPIDVWTGKPPRDSALQVRLLETDGKPIRASDGSYVFLDYGADRCTLQIVSPTYRTVRQDVDLTSLHPREPVLTVGLLPNASYPPPPASTGLVFTVRDEAGRPLADVDVEAYVQDEAAARCRVADGEAKAGAALLRVAVGSGKLSPGDAFALRERGGDKLEWNAVAGYAGDETSLTLASPLLSSWSRGALLLAAVLTRSDGKGTVVVPFRGTLPAAFAVAVNFRLAGKEWKDVWTVESGRLSRLPPVTLK